MTDWIPLIILILIILLWAVTAGREVEKDNKELVSFYAKRKK